MRFLSRWRQFNGMIIPNKTTGSLWIRTGGRIICCSHFWTNHIIQLWDDNHIIELSYHNGILYITLSYHIISFWLCKVRYPHSKMARNGPRHTSHWEALKSARQNGMITPLTSKSLVYRAWFRTHIFVKHGVSSWCIHGKKWWYMKYYEVIFQWCIPNRSPYIQSIICHTQISPHIYT